ncbi:MAG TPA: ParA family protein [Isosphaeraceae bacterium]|nr:ParA family protein [Isosphaeraceae bacterium]
MSVVCMLNQKGGVGKSSSCHHLAGTLAKMGRRVLLVDNDPQASLTQGFFGPDTTRDIDPAETVAALYDPRFGAIPEALIRPTAFEGVSLVPGSEALTTYNITPPAAWPHSERGMAEFLGEIRDAFDVVLIDCPPNLHLCSWAALVAADFLVVPLQAEDYGAQGLGPVQRSIHAVQSGPNPSLRLLGYLLTMFDKRLGIHTAYETLLRQLYGADVFTTPFPLAKDFKEAVASRLPISHYKPKSAAAKATRAVAEELLARIEAATSGTVESERSVA